MGKVDAGYFGSNMEVVIRMWHEKRDKDEESSVVFKAEDGLGGEPYATIPLMQLLELLRKVRQARSARIEVHEIRKSIFGNV